MRIAKRTSTFRPVEWLLRQRYFRLCASVALAAFAIECHTSYKPIIAMIPRTTGTGLWEPEQGGGQTAARRDGYRIYWNAPAREDDVGKQIALVQRADQQNVAGLVLSPSQSLALITPVRHAVDHGIPTVIVSSPLPLPGGGRLSYVMNDDDLGGRLAAQRVELVTHCIGSIAILGVNPDITGIMTRARSLEVSLAKDCPALRIVKKHGTFNLLHEQQIAEATLSADPSILVIVALMWSSTRGALSAIHQRNNDQQIQVIGFDPDSVLPFSSPAFNSAVMQDTRKMGEEAVDLIALARRGAEMPPVKKIAPTLVTRENQNAPAIRQLAAMLSGPFAWEGSAQP